MIRPRVVIFCGNFRRPSRSRILAEALGAEVGRRIPVDLKVYDILDAGPGFGSALARADLPLPAARIIDEIESADALIVGTPVYKGAYTGLFKHLIDFVDPGRLAGKPVALTATGGGLRHALMVEHALRPLFGFFAALTVPTAVYASETDFTEISDEAGHIVTDAGIRARLAGAADELSRLIPKRAGVAEAIVQPARVAR
ncbi:NAD(P)H-dependent oxidoreductase [Microvirga terrestris]|uniref:NAD(P)H-dependent oxidoreductase n=1 Tax=Microvirga terrestris TaxID=2791024 RepID=A0ABS0HUY4_9HYPH|nr:NAD(P)H-dependent oxidoreductase [Microvirga terrestris]MBF9197310.1 NAD(P)H-dependent oxidoreductase [Microvirga terrestris]